MKARQNKVGQRERIRCTWEGGFENYGGKMRKIIHGREGLKIKEER